MQIPVEVLEQYGVSTNHLDDEYGTYDTFLKVTNTAIIEAFETLMSNPTSFLTNIISIARDNATLMQYRTIARQEMIRLKAGQLLNPQEPETPQEQEEPQEPQSMDLF